MSSVRALAFKHAQNDPLVYMKKTEKRMRRPTMSKVKVKEKVPYLVP